MVIFAFILLSWNHAVYISVIDFTHHEEGNKITVKVFSNDLEDALFNFSSQRIKVSSNCSEVKEVVVSYFSKYLKIWVNEKEQKFLWDGCQVNDDSTWITFITRPTKSFKEVKIKADYLIELFPTQTNVVNISSDGEKRFLKLNGSHREADISFD
jgi:hypothetical protein